MGYQPHEADAVVSHLRHHGPTSLEGLFQATALHRRTLNEILLDLNLARKIHVVVGREKNRKATLYALRETH